MWTPTESTDKRFPVLIEDEITGAPIDLFTVEAARELAGRMLAVCDRIEGKPPTPMPAPALGMRVWATAPDIGGVGGRKVRNYDVHRTAPGATWADYTNDGDTIDLITDFRTGEVLWRRS